ncbi:unnamed protein product [Menidia menidia]|uniref:(Atlantic silverside) hypothetical protein n=1 Tax=Menidia menidia TaxID=238744 RepID=A0A8S4BSN2_9TELE|nr:unnamed protein product [Menidia menidia]
MCPQAVEEQSAKRRFRPRRRKHALRGRGIRRRRRRRMRAAMMAREWSLNTVYGRNAEEVKAALLAAHPGLTVVLNPEKPRRNSFEITLLDGGTETCLWTGIKKGPPRKLKFPEADVVVAALQKAL